MKLRRQKKIFFSDVFDRSRHRALSRVYFWNWPFHRSRSSRNRNFRLIHLRFFPGGRNSSFNNQIIMADLSSRDVEKANFAFSIYDLDGSGTVDAYYLGDVLRGLNLNPTNATIEKLGGTKKKGEKSMKIDEFLPIFSQCKKDKDHGGFEDFLECLKLYDKQENGLMLGAELSHTLLALGERLTDAECEEVMKDCSPPEDDEGFIAYEAFLKNLCAKPPE